ncbi:MAG: PD-(D/E)XK nuclease family protein [Pseudomonadota bacterium]
MTFKSAFNRIRKLINDIPNAPDKIGSTLISSRIPHLSYSMISSFEACPQKYYLEYVERVKLHPAPLYFAKGNALHSAAQNLYSRKSVTGLPITLKKKMLRGIKETKDIRHIKNAFELMMKNRWEGQWQVLDTERPFVMQIQEELPPFFGIIDLILKNGDQHVVVDHKTGNTFYELDPVQLVFYREYVKQEYNSKKVDTYYDQYRWVNNLDRLRKPAFLRSKVPLKTNDTRKAIARARRAYEGMIKITAPVNSAFSDTCYQCQFRNHCF